MDNSQRSDVFSGSVHLSIDSDIEMDLVTYDSLITNTKLAFRSIKNEIQKETFSTYFNSLLKDCHTCITHCSYIINGLLEEPDVQLIKIIEYTSDATCLLQMLSDFMITVIKSVSMSCCDMKMFPKTVGQIIMTVFTHCKDSEYIYGHHLRTVEMQLKNLFRTCHELQLTYLMILDKHYIFDLTEKEEQDILLEALDINLKIGEIVQHLDVKTLAEQWKAYTLICERHSSNLMNKSIYHDCTDILCKMIRININTAMKSNQEERAMLRSLKVASFTIKILTKICTIFKDATEKKYEDIVELLLYIHLNSSSYNEMTGEKSIQFTNLMNINVLVPSGSLLKELLLDDTFANSLFNYDMEKITKEPLLLGYILVMTSVIKLVLQRNEDQIMNNYKCKIIECVYKFLPYSFTWFNMELNFKTEPNQHKTYGLHEHLLIHTTGLAASMINEQFQTLEICILEAILSTNSCSALFSSNLWVLLARTMIDRHLLFKQWTSLTKMLMTLNNDELFSKSPQDVHLSNTISRLFEAMPNEDKIKIYKQYNIYDDDNSSLWIALKISNLPEELQTNAEEVVTEKLILQFHKLANADVNQKGMYQLINIMKLAATYSFKTCYDTMEDLVMMAWMKACLKNNRFLGQELDKSTVWYYEYIEALASLTNSMLHHIFKKNSGNLIKVLHVITTIIQLNITELKLVLIKILCNIATCDISDENSQTDSILMQILIQLFQDTDHTIRNNLFSHLVKYKNNRKVDEIISNIINQDYSLLESWNNFVSHNLTKEKSMLPMDFKYNHKCLEERNVIELSDSEPVEMKNTGSNFELANIETLFDIDSDTEQPVCKKAKLDTNETDLIIERLENDVSFLCGVKDILTAENKARLKNVCQKLQNIV